MDTNVSVETRHEFYELCKTYLNGKWSEVTANDITISSLLSGFLNELYVCCLPDANGAEYAKVVVRLTDYERFKPYCTKSQIITNNIVISDHNLCPKLLAVMTDGFISQYIDCRYFDRNDDHNDRAVSLLAGKLAKLHSLSVPIARRCDAGTDLLSKINLCLTPEVRESYSRGFLRQQIQAMDSPLMSAWDVPEELLWLSTTAREMRSPIVFSHNDFNRRNILVTNSGGDSGNDGHDMDVLLIDFDLSGYDYRGVDFGRYFSSWSHRELDFGSGEFPTDDQMLVFIDAYIREMTAINGNSYTELQINSHQRLIKESKMFALMAYLKGIIYCLFVFNTYNERTNQLLNAEKRLECYVSLKSTIMKEGPNI